MSIVCGTDFSAGAGDAAQVAALLAQRGKEPLVLVHALEEGLPTGSPAGAKGSVPDLYRRLATQEADRLRGLHGAAQLIVLDQVVAGSADEVLADLSRQPDVHLVVVSSLGRRLPSRWLLGSVAERTVQTSAVPVLVVRQADRLVSWLTGTRPLRVLVGVDFTASAEGALRWVANLGRFGPCETIAGHVYWPPEQRSRLGIHGPGSLVESHPEIERVLRRDLGERMKSVLKAEPTGLRIKVGFGNTADHLLQLADDEQVDLIVVGTHQREGLSRWWHGSVSAGVVRHARMSVVCVPVVAPAKPSAGAAVVRSVLAATDFSDLGNKAVLFAFSLLPAGGRVHVVHVADPDGERPPAELAEELRQTLAGSPVQRGVDSQVEVILGRDPAQAISAAAERLGVDLICIGTHGRSGLARALLGSVAQGVLAHSDRPVVVIRRCRQG